MPYTRIYIDIYVYRYLDNLYANNCINLVLFLSVSLSPFFSCTLGLAANKNETKAKANQNTFLGRKLSKNVQLKRARKRERARASFGYINFNLSFIQVLGPTQKIQQKKNKSNNNNKCIAVARRAASP